MLIQANLLRLSANRRAVVIQFGLYVQKLHALKIKQLISVSHARPKEAFNSPPAVY